jgi:alkanesulfonate monooxygenase SsuD/methylene tetrahydromethanopterin reductase-like flavin-dependent oxidoreductase (luciferase family)
MDYGFVFFGSVQIHPAVALAEKRGFTHAWLYDSQMLASDVYAALALCAANTKKIFLGPGVTNPASRIAPLTACSIASINALAPGRAILGIGTGNTARRTLGMPAARLEVLREHVRVCRDLLEGKTTAYQEGERRRMIRFLNPKSGAINIKKKVPIYVSASGPKTLELAGEIADGVILFGAVSPSLIDFCMSHVRTGAERAGRDPRKIYTLCMTAFYLTKPGEKLQTPRVQKAVGPFVTSSSNIFAFSCPNPADLPADLRDDLVAFKTAYRAPDESIETRHLTLYSDYLQGFKKEHETLVTEKMIRATTLTGTRDEVMESIQAMQKAGIKQVAIQAVTDPKETIESFSKEIIRRMK